MIGISYTIPSGGVCVARYIYIYIYIYLSFVPLFPGMSLRRRTFSQKAEGADRSRTVRSLSPRSGRASCCMSRVTSLLNSPPPLPLVWIHAHVLVLAPLSGHFPEGNLVSVSASCELNGYGLYQTKKRNDLKSAESTASSGRVFLHKCFTDEYFPLCADPAQPVSVPAPPAETSYYMRS